MATSDLLRLRRSHPRRGARPLHGATGRTPLPPLWALGNQQSRWGYKTADEVRAIAREFRARDIPCDALYLDIDYMDGYRVFTWDRERFPDPAGLTAELAGQGFRVVTIVDPGVKVDEGFAVYRDGRAADLYCKTYHGAEYHNVVWPGTCAFPDFTNPRTREWWGDQHRALLDAGVAGIWCDMNEPTVFVPTPATMPPDVVQPGGGDAPPARPGPQPLRLPDGARHARGPRATPPRAPTIRHHPLRLRRPPARRPPLDRRQFVLVGAPLR